MSNRGSEPATRRQRWMLWTLTKDTGWYDLDITIANASEEIATRMKAKRNQQVQKMVDFQTIWQEAMAAGDVALARCEPVPMVVQQHTNVLDDKSPVEKQWLVPSGVCGFAWVNIKPATSAFAKWLKDQGHVRTDSYYGGITYWVGQGGQSMERKEAFARSMAEVLRKHGISAQSMSRMD